MIVSTSAVLAAGGSGIVPAPWIWMSNVQHPADPIEAGGKSEIGAVNFYVAQPSVVYSVDIEIGRGRVNALSYSNLGTVLMPGWHHIVMYGTVPAIVAKKEGCISWKLNSLIATDLSGNQVRIYGGPFKVCREVVKRGAK